MGKTVNTRVKLLRTHLNLTQQDFSSLVGLTSTQLSRIENGESAPQKGTLKQIIDRTGVNSEWLLEGKGELKVLAVINKTQDESNPYRDYAIQRLEKEAETWQQKYNELFQMFRSVLERGSAKHKATELAGLNFRKVNRSVARA